MGAGGHLRHGRRDVDGVRATISSKGKVRRGAAGNGEGEHVATPKSWKWLISPGRVKCFSCPQQIWRQRLRACMDKHVGDHVVKREARSA